jgi:hypothetical protein
MTRAHSGMTCTLTCRAAVRAASASVSSVTALKSASKPIVSRMDHLGSFMTRAPSGMTWRPSWLRWSPLWRVVPQARDQSVRMLRMSRAASTAWVAGLPVYASASVAVASMPGHMNGHQLMGTRA